MGALEGINTSGDILTFAKENFIKLMQQAEWSETPAHDRSAITFAEGDMTIFPSFGGCQEARCPVQHCDTSEGRGLLAIGRVKAPY